MTHTNAAGQRCDGQTCAVCGRCSACAFAPGNGNRGGAGWVCETCDAPDDAGLPVVSDPA